MSTILDVHAREVFDSRGNPTVEVEVFLEDGSYGRAIVPSGASTGEREAVELRDGDKKRLMGKGVLKAVDNVNNKIAEEIVGMDALNQVEIDKTLIELDGTPNKEKLGANAILGVSLATAYAAANYLGLPLYRYIGGTNAKIMPVPMANIINGGKHADNKVDFQEFMIMPIGAKSIKEAIVMMSEVFHNLKAVLKKAGKNTSVGDEGGFAPDIDNEDAFKYILEAIDKAGYKAPLDLSGDFAIAIDCASSELFEEGDKKGYKFWKSNPDKILNSDQMIELFKDYLSKYPIISIEDPLDQNDWEGYQKMTAELGKKVQIVGDDLFVTNPSILKKGIQMGVCNAILIKLNQIGTLTETIDAVEMAQKAGYTAIVSHRSGETEDATIADLVVALNTGQIKTGSMSRTDRMAKYNQLIRIEEELGEAAQYLGKQVFYNIYK